MRILVLLLGLSIVALADPETATAQGAAQVVAEFSRLAAEGKAALERVQNTPNDGQDHVPIGTTVRYRTDPPLSGNHWPLWADPGIYNEIIPNEALVHSLEHGHIVIYIERPSAEATRLLQQWVALWRGMWDGIVIVPRPNLGSEVILTAWTRSLRMSSFEPAAAAAFIDAYRGRGPENPVR